MALTYIVSVHLTREYLYMYIAQTPKISLHYTAQKMKFSIKNFFSKYDESRRKLRIWSHLLKKSLLENFIFCAVLPKQLVGIRQKRNGLAIADRA